MRHLPFTSRSDAPSCRPVVAGAMARKSLVIALLVWAPSASADGMTAELLTRIMVAAGATAVGLVVATVVLVFLFARLLGLTGGILSAVLSVVLGVIVTIAMAFVGGILFFFLPQELLNAVGIAAGVLGGGVGVKLTYRTDLGHGMLVYLLATSCVYLLLGLFLVVVF